MIERKGKRDVGERESMIKREKQRERERVSEKVGVRCRKRVQTQSNQCLNPDNNRMPL